MYASQMPLRIWINFCTYFARASETERAAPVYSADILNIYPKFYFQQTDLKPTNQVYDRSDFSLFLFFVPLQATKQLMRSTNR